MSPRMPPAVTAADRWADSTDKQRFFTCYILHVGCSWWLWNFLITVICSTFCKVQTKAAGTAVVLEGQDSKTSVQNGNWYDRQHVHDTKQNITGTNINVTYILCEHCLVIHCYRTVTMIKPDTSLYHRLYSSVMYITCFTTHTATKQTA